MLPEEIVGSLKSLIQKHGLKAIEIEKECGLSQNSLSSIMSGKRKFPMKHKERLQAYCKAKEIGIILGSNALTFPYSRGEQELQLPRMKSLGILVTSQTFEQDVTSVIILAERYKTELQELKADIEAKIKSGPPKNLAELKALCPKELEGFDKSQWISKERQKYGI